MLPTFQRTINADLASLHNFGQVFQVDLVDDAGGWWHDGEVVECLLAPAQKFVALAVAFELDLGVESQRVVGSKHVDLN